MSKEPRAGKVSSKTGLVQGKNSAPGLHNATAAKKNLKKNIPEWVKGEKTITHEAINRFLEVPDDLVSLKTYYQASDKLLQVVSSSEIKKSQNSFAVLEQKAVQKDL